MTIDSIQSNTEYDDSIYTIDPATVLSGLDMAPNEVVIGGPESCFTVTGLKVESTRDALIIFEACRQGILPRITRRLNDAEKQQIGDGTVIVFDEKEAGMKRWTDGKLWTPSRILGNFLTYRELEKKLPPNQQGVAEIARWTDQTGGEAETMTSGKGELNIPISYEGGARGDPAVPDSAYGTNKGVYFIKINGLIKRTISLSVPDNEDEFLARNEWRPLKVHHQHLVVYFRAETAAQLPRPEDMEELESLRLPLKILQIQKFRRPMRIEMFDDGTYDFHDSEETEGGSCADDEASGQQSMAAGTGLGYASYQNNSNNTSGSSAAAAAAAALVGPQRTAGLPPSFPFQLAALVGGGGYHQPHPTPLVLQPPVAANNGSTSNSSSAYANAPRLEQMPSAASIEFSSYDGGNQESSDFGNSSSNTSLAMYHSYDLATLPAQLPFADAQYAHDLFNPSSFALASQLLEPLGASEAQLEAEISNSGAEIRKDADDGAPDADDGGDESK
ncbi:Global transcription regulator sge1 [Coemansia sp. RSA 2049]|nr:Global transcription regulator sge1 [Coemansia sp. RSA 2049]